MPSIYLRNVGGTSVTVPYYGFKPVRPVLIIFVVVAQYRRNEAAALWMPTYELKRFRVVARQFVAYIVERYGFALAVQYCVVIAQMYAEAYNKI